MRHADIVGLMMVDPTCSLRKSREAHELRSTVSRRSHRYDCGIEALKSVQLR